MLKYLLLILILNFDLINCCSYLITKSDLTIHKCLNNECEKYIDPYLIMVEPNNCKTNFLYLSFSSYKTFHLFLNRIQWKLSNLFLSKSNEKNRLLRIYFSYINSTNDQFIDQIQLNRLGNNIDFYELFIFNLTNFHFYQKLIHYYSNYPQWKIIKIQFICNNLNIYDDKPCTSRILSPPSSFTSQYSPSTISLSTILLNKQENLQSIHLLIIILIPLVILFLTIILSTFIYRNFIEKQLSNKDLTNSSIPSLSNNKNNKNRESSEYDYGRNAVAYKISRLPPPHKDSLYKEAEEYF